MGIFFKEVEPKKNNLKYVAIYVHVLKRVQQGNNQDNQMFRLLKFFVHTMTKKNPNGNAIRVKLLTKSII
jgi:hypothetical protein